MEDEGFEPSRSCDNRAFPLHSRSAPPYLVPVTVLETTTTSEPPTFNPVVCMSLAHLRVSSKWSGRRATISQPPGWKPGTLPIELLPHERPIRPRFFFYLVYHFLCLHLCKLMSDYGNLDTKGLDYLLYYFYSFRRYVLLLVESFQCEG